MDKISKILSFIAILITNFGYAQSHFSHGGGTIDPPHEKVCVPPALEYQILDQLETNRTMLVEKGILPAEKGAWGSESITTLSWPLQGSASFQNYSYYDVTNFVDLDLTSNIQDYNCTSRSYDGHNGTDISLWPFWWLMMENEEVEIIASAPGVIIGKDDGNFDMNCDCVGNWNAVYIEHADGSTAWYGHMKTNSLTSKGVGESVALGEYLGLVGSSGCSSNPHLHLEIRDENNNVVDPFQGPCNQTTNETWWDNQRPFWEPTLNALMTHDGNPDIIGFCPSEEFSFIQNQFYPGDLVRFAGYFHDQQMGDIANFKVYNPSGIEVFSWILESPDTYIRSWWWYSDALPLNAEEGIWTFEIEYLGNTFSHEFQVGDPSSTLEIPENSLHIFPNPSSQTITIECPFKGEFQARLIDVNGRTIIQEKGVDSIITILVNELSSGAYLLEVKNEDQEVFVKKILIE